MPSSSGGSARDRAGIPHRRLLLLLAAAAVAVALVLDVAGRMSRPATHAAWAGPLPGGLWTATSLRLQTNVLLADPTHPVMLLAGTDDGVWSSHDGGVQWVRAGMRGHLITALAMASDSSDLYAGDDTGTVYTGRDLLGSLSWQPVSPILGTSPVYSLAVSRAPPVVLAGTTGALYRGARGARGWQWQHAASTGDASISSILWFPEGSREALASVFGESPSLLASDDAGRTWSAATDGLPAVLPTQALLALDTEPPQVILTTMGGGVWERSAGSRWHDISLGLPERHAMPLVTLANHGRPVLYAGTMGYGVYVRQESAAWLPFGRGLTGVENTVLALAVSANPSGPSPALLAATQFGVFRYVTNG